MHRKCFIQWSACTVYESLGSTVLDHLEKRLMNTFRKWQMCKLYFRLIKYIHLKHFSRYQDLHIKYIYNVYNNIEKLEKKIGKLKTIWLTDKRSISRSFPSKFRHPDKFSCSRNPAPWCDLRRTCKLSRLPANRSPRTPPLLFWSSSSITSAAPRTGCLFGVNKRKI